MNKYLNLDGLQQFRDKLDSSFAAHDHEHSWNDLNDKPFGENNSEVALFNESNILYEETLVDYIPYMVAYVDAVNYEPIEEGKVYHAEIISDGSYWQESSGETVVNPISNDPWLNVVLAHVLNQADMPTTYIDFNPRNEYGEDIHIYIFANESSSNYLVIGDASTGWVENGICLKLIENVITRIDEEFIPDTIARKSEIDSFIKQADWKQTDETQKDFIKNKPNEEDALKIVVEMGLVELVTANDGSIYTDENGAIYSLI